MGKSALSSSSPRAEEQGRGGTPAAALGRWPGARGRPGPWGKGKWGPGGRFPSPISEKGACRSGRGGHGRGGRTAAMGGAGRGGSG